MKQCTLFEAPQAKPKRLSDEQKTAREKAREAKQEALARAIPAGKFGVILADPPWRHEFAKSKIRATENHYPTMTQEEIKALPVSQIAYETSLCYMWTTVSKLPESLQVMAAWGFCYRTSFVWVKDKIGLGYWNRNQHELLLLGKRGAFPTPRPGDLVSSAFHAPRLEHSRKPEAIAEMIERQFPQIPKVELFCRRPRPGWSVWGNEVSSDIELDIRLSG